MFIPSLNKERCDIRQNKLCFLQLWSREPLASILRGFDQNPWLPDLFQELQKFDADKQSECEDVHAKLDVRRIDAMADIVNGSDHKDYECVVRRD